MSDSRRPAPLLPPSSARLAGFAALGSMGAVEWARMGGAIGSARPFAWVVSGLAGALLVLGAARLRPRLRRGAVVAAGAVALVVAVALSGLDLALLRPRRWDELAEGLARGAEALGSVRLPYAGRDPWPVAALEVAGALLCTVAALLAVWPRGRRGGGDGYPLAALALLLVLVVSPVVSLADPRPLVLGSIVAGLAAGFLWLERVPSRPGAGAALVALVALAAALPLGAAADREEPWFDYRSFAESLGPGDPIRFSWEHGYGPVDWGRDGVEVLRVSGLSEPLYWKSDVLSDFDGERWRIGKGADPDGDRPEDDLPLGWQRRSGWDEEFTVTLRRLRTSTVVGAGTITEVLEPTRPVEPDVPGRWIVAGPELRSGDSYTVRAHVPRPSPAQLAAATSGATGAQAEGRRMRVRIRPDALHLSPRTPPSPSAPGGRPLEDAIVEVPPYGAGDGAVALYPLTGVTADGEAALRRSTVARTWRLSRRLMRGTTSPYEYVLRVNSFLRGDRFSYSELPAPDGSEVGIERFLFETRRGYCQQFSGAMALLLRLGGVPARVATGFSPGGFRKRRGDWVVRDTDAHSWVEAWFDDVGWVTFDPTPPATPARSQVAAIDPLELPAELGGTGDAAAGAPPARSPEGRAGRFPDPSAAGGAAAAEAAPGGGGSRVWRLLAVAAVLGAAAAAAVYGARRGRRTRTPAPDPEIAELLTALRRTGRPVGPGTTLAQLERRLGLGAAAQGYLRALARWRYGTGGPPTQADRRALRRELASGLGWRGAAVALWALPPRPGRASRGGFEPPA